MTRKIQFEGQTHLFPDDATDEEIATALEAMSADGPLAPQDNAGGVGHTLGDNRKMSDEQILTTLKAQLSDPYRDTASDAELRAEIARISKRASAAAPAAASAPRAFQADVRASEPPGTLAAQEAAERRFNAALKAWLKTPRGQYYAGPEAREQFAKATGRRDPLLDREGAELQHARETGDVPYGTGTTYQVAKPLAATVGYAYGGPAGATGAEFVVRLTALGNNLDKAVKAGAIDEDRAAEILYSEMIKGTVGDAAWNFGLPLVGQLAMKIPGAKWITTKVGDLFEAGLRRMGRAPAPAPTLRGKKIEKRAALTDDPVRQQAVRELGARTDEVIPSPGQVRGEAGRWETIVRKGDPAPFNRSSQKLVNATDEMLQGATRPPTQPEAQAMGEQIQSVADKTQQAVKKRLRPAFQAADDLGVKVDLREVRRAVAKALTADGKVPGGKLAANERQQLEQIFDDLRENPMRDAEQALDFISRRKEQLRSITADWTPSSAYSTLIGDLTSKADEAFARAAGTAGKGDVVRDLLSAQKQYKEMMGTVYDDAIAAALKKNPEDLGRHFWQGGNVSEIQQLQRMLDIARRERVMSPKAADKLAGDVTRGFLQEAVPNVEAAARWSQMLKESPAKRRTWDALTSAPGGKELRDTMRVIEQAAQIASKSNLELVGGSLTPVGRAMSGGMGVSFVQGNVHPGMVATGLSLIGLTKAAATAYTQGNKGVINTIAKIVRLESAGTGAAAKAAQAAAAELREWAAKNDVDLEEQETE